MSARLVSLVRRARTIAEPCLRAAAAGCIACSAGSSWAQSSVTLYGLIDMNLRAVKNDAWAKTLSNDGIGVTQLGVRGSEDLGGGMRAEFWLEGQIVPDTGGPSPFAWRRRATVGLVTPAGEVRLGRDYTPSYWNLAKFEPFRGIGVGNGNNLEPIAVPRPPLGSAAGTLVRADDAVVYLTPQSTAPFYFHAMVAAGEGTPGNKYVGARAGYAAAGFETAVAFGRTQGDAADNTFSVINGGVSYDFGPLTLMGMAHQMKFLARKQRNLLLGLTAPFGADELRASIQWADQSGSGTDADDARQVAVGYVHNLSQRTALYGAASHIRNKGRQAFTASASGGALRPGGDSTGLEIGIRRLF